MFFISLYALKGISVTAGTVVAVAEREREREREGFSSLRFNMSGPDGGFMLVCISGKEKGGGWGIRYGVKLETWTHGIGMDLVSLSLYPYS